MHPWTQLALLLGAVCLGVFSACGEPNSAQPEMSGADTSLPVTRQKVSQPEYALSDKPSFASLSSEFNNHYKRALFYSDRLMREETMAGLERAEQSWEQVMDYYLMDQPDRYALSENWIVRIQGVQAALRQAREKAMADSLFEAHLLLEPVQREMRQLRLENGIDALRDHVVALQHFLEAALAEVPSKDLNLLDAMQEEIDRLKHWPSRTNDSQYQQRVSDLQRALDKARTSNDEAYLDHLQSFQAAFTPFYLLYG